MLFCSALCMDLYVVCNNNRMLLMVNKYIFFDHMGNWGEIAYSIQHTAEPSTALMYDVCRQAIRDCGEFIPNLNCCYWNYLE